MTEVLETIAPPYSAEFVSLFLPLVENEEITGITCNSILLFVISPSSVCSHKHTFVESKLFDIYIFMLRKFFITSISEPLIDS